jgi:hypothetical protein
MSETHCITQKSVCYRTDTLSNISQPSHNLRDASKIPIDPEFMKLPAVQNPIGHEVRATVQPPKKFGIHGETVAVDLDICISVCPNDSKRSAVKPQMQVDKR